MTRKLQRNLTNLLCTMDVFQKQTVGCMICSVTVPKNTHTHTGSHLRNFTLRNADPQFHRQLRTSFRISRSFMVRVSFRILQNPRNPSEPFRVFYCSESFRVLQKTPSESFCLRQTQSRLRWGGQKPPRQL